MRRAVSSATPWPARALVVLRVSVGVFLIVKSISKFGWLLDGSPLTARLIKFAANQDVIALSRWYAQWLLPGAPVFARLSLIGELGGGIALIVGFRTRIVATLAALMILNYHLATGGLVDLEFLSEANGLVTVGALLALAIGASNLPWSVTRS